MRYASILCVGGVVLGGCSGLLRAPRADGASRLAAAEAFVAAFYSFNPERLRAALSAAPESVPRIVYYQGWAQGGNYQVVQRTPCRVESREQVSCSVTVRDDLIQALGTGFNVTDTFHLGFDRGRIVSVRTTSNDPPEFDRAMEWVQSERADLVGEPCRDAFEGGTTPQACVRAMVRGFRQYALRSVLLPLRDARAITVVDEWRGYSPVSPTRSAYSLVRSADGSFAGTVQISVGSGLIRRDTSFAVRLPAPAADSLLQALSSVPLREGGNGSTLTHTDDYPSITAELTVGDSVIRFHTVSQGAAHVPWGVRTGERTYASDSEAIWAALSAALERMGRGEQRALIQAARDDPEAQCVSRDFMAAPQPRPARRPRSAGGEAWFIRDSTLTVSGARYRKRGLPRVLTHDEISPYATYRGITVYQEAGIEGTPAALYVPVHSSCEVQPYALEP